MDFMNEPQQIISLNPAFGSDGPSQTKPLARDALGVAILNPKEWQYLDGHFFRRDEHQQVISLARANAPTWNDSAASNVPQMPPRTFETTEKLQMPIVDNIWSQHLGCGVYRFPALLKSTCDQIIDQAEEIAAYQKVKIDHVGLHLKCAPTCWTYLESMVSEQLQAHFEEYSLSLLSAFVVCYKTGQSHSVHRDDADITLNICLGREFQGGDLSVEHISSGTKLAVKHELGVGLMHYGRLVIRY